MRKRKLIFNTISGIFNELILLICDFIVPRETLLIYGSDVNGLITSITQYLGFIALTEMGVGAVVKSALYKPLASNDENEINEIIKSANDFFRKIGKVLIYYIIFLCIFFPIIIHSDFSYGYIVPLIMAISVNSIAQYYFGIVNQLLLAADQKSYVYLLLNSTSLVVNTVVSVLLMKSGASIQLVKMAVSLALLIKPTGMYLYVKKHYNIDRNIELTHEPIKQKWNGIAQHLASFVLSHTDVIVLTTFSTLKNVSIYNVYYMVVAGIRRLLTTSMTGVEAFFGNLYAKADPDLHRYFGVYEWIMHTGVVLLFSVTALLICPFISVYTKGVNDANYIYPVFGALLAGAYGVYCIRLPYNTMVLAAGHYKETQSSAIFEAFINIVVSCVFVWKFGLYGVAIGTLVAMLYRSCYLAFYLSKSIMQRPFKHYCKHIFIDIIVILCVVLSTKHLVTYVNGYFEWILLAIKIFAVAFAEILSINYFVYKSSLIDAINIIRRKRI